MQSAAGPVPVQHARVGYRKAALGCGYKCRAEVDQLKFNDGGTDSFWLNWQAG